MKFISGIKCHPINSKVEIKIPFYHRTSISFFNESYVYYITRTFESNNSLIRELILTPIIPDNWHHVRRITINAIDSPGIINAITTKLRDLKINVNIEEALTTQIGAIHNINLIVDLGFYIHENNINTGGKIPNEALSKLEVELRNLINPVTNQNIVYDGQISIKELTFLESISNIPSNFPISNIPDFQFRDCANQKIKNRNGRVELSENILNDLSLNNSHSFYYTMFSDTEEKYIKIVFFDPNQSVTFIGVHHQDIYGAIAKFTEIIYKDYNYNILASYSHQQMQKETAHWYALVDITNKSKEFFTETLDALRTAKYGDKGANKKVLNVFLIESNVETISDDILINFGQNKLGIKRVIF